MVIKIALVVTFALVVSACLTGDDPQTEGSPVTIFSAVPTTTNGVALTTTTVQVIAEWVEAFPKLGVPNDTLEICGVVHGPRRMDIVVSYPDTGDTWPVNTDGAVRTLDTGQWCWEGEFPAELQKKAGERYPIEPGVYDIEIKYEGEAILHTTFGVSSPELIAAMPPSQPAEEARRDGVIPEIAELPFYRRVRPELEMHTDEGVWMR